MNEEFEECISKKKLFEFAKARMFVDREVKEAEKDLEIAKDSLKRKNYKWATIQAYFSMFHCARSLIYRVGYREKSHYCLIIALRTFYLKKGLINHKVIEDIQLGRRMREGADYHADFSKGGAKALTKSAEDFLSITHEIIKKSA